MPTGTAGPPKMPVWVKVFIAIGALILIVAVVVLLVGGGQHGPGRHFGADGSPTATHSPTHTPPTTHHSAAEPDRASPPEPG